MEKRQSILSLVRLAQRFQAEVRRRSSLKVAIRWRAKHWRDHRLASSSAGLSQLPWIGV